MVPRTRMGGASWAHAMGAATIAAKPNIPSERASRVRDIVSSLIVPLGGVRPLRPRSIVPGRLYPHKSFEEGRPALRLDARGHQFSAAAELLPVRSTLVSNGDDATPSLNRWSP